MPSDSDAGVGVGTPITTVEGSCPNIPETFLTLEKYWEFLQINECAGYGIRNYPTNNVIGMGCGDFWQQDERFFLTSSIAKAEARLESDRWLGFPVKRKYFTARQLEYRFPAYLGKHLRGVGVETQTLVKASQHIDLRTAGVINDPVKFTVTVNFSDIDELIIYYPNTTACKINPSSVSISGSTATIKIPRCRLLKPSFFQNYKNDNDRPDYTDDNNFLDSVDIYRNYLDTTTGANLVWWRHEGQLFCYDNVFVCDPVNSCSDVKQLACPYVVRQRDGYVQFEPATYSGGWKKSSYAVKRRPDGLEVNFMKGFYDRYDDIREDLTRAIIAMAHNNLPQDYCNCSVQTLYYKKDNRPLEPPVRLKSGQSTWGLYEAEQIVREFDMDRVSHNGGML